MFVVVDEFVQLSKRIQQDLMCWHGNGGDIEMNKIASQQTKDFIDVTNYDTRLSNFKHGLYIAFGTYHETGLRGLTNYLIEKIDEVFIATFTLTKRICGINIERSNWIINNVKMGDMTEEQVRIRKDNDFLLFLHDNYYWHCEVMLDSIRHFMPDEYKKHSPEWSKYIKCVDMTSPTDQEPNSEEPDVKNSKETFTKDQILLLNELGVFDIPAIKDLTTENKGKLFARLLNRNEKNVMECIRNCDPSGNKHAEDNPYIYENKVSAVNELLAIIGFSKKL